MNLPGRSAATLPALGRVVTDCQVFRFPHVCLVRIVQDDDLRRPKVAEWSGSPWRRWRRRRLRGEYDPLIIVILFAFRRFCLEAFRLVRPLTRFAGAPLSRGAFSRLDRDNRHGRLSRQSVSHVPAVIDELTRLRFAPAPSQHSRGWGPAACFLFSLFSTCTYSAG